jgi:hypothetical protein
MNLGRSIIVILVVASTFLTACSSRYRLDLHVTTDGYQLRVKVESSEFAAQCALGDPYSEVKTIAGTGSCLVLTLKGRGSVGPQEKEQIIRFDEHMTFRLNVELPSLEKGRSLNLVDNSFVHRLGRYDIPAEEKIYLPTSGTMIMDSLAGDFLFATAHGKFATRGGKQLSVDGQFRARIAR